MHPDIPVISMIDADELTIELACGEAEAAAIRDSAREKAALRERMLKDAQELMRTVEPCLEEAMRAMDGVTKMDLSEVKAFAKVPASLERVFEAVNMMLGERKPDWSSAKKRLADPSFLQTIATFDKDNIPSKTTKAVHKLLQDPQLEPENVRKVSRVGYALCLWLRAMQEYDKVAKSLEPMRAALKATDESLGVIDATLREREAKLVRDAARLDALTSRACASVAAAVVGARAGGARDATLDQLYDSAHERGDAAPTSDELRALRAEWASWATAWPAPCAALPGEGRAADDGRSEYHKLVGAELPAIDVVRAPDDAWRAAVRSHVRNVWARRNQPRLVAGRDATPTTDEALAAERAAMDQLSAGLQRYVDGAEALLSAWPRGAGAGELLAEPIIDETPVGHRGVTPEYWAAVTSRAAFATTRVFVECFVKPLTRAHACSLWFFVPPAYRCEPEVFLSHSWDGSIWDLRPPCDVHGVWIDTVTVNQHPRARGADEDEVSVVDLYPEVNEIQSTVVAIGRTRVAVPISGVKGGNLAPFKRSWCVFEMLFTPEKQLDVSMGWNVWDLATHEAILDEIDELDVARAQTTSPDDKRKIDTLVVDHFGSFAEANTIFRKLVCACFLHAARAALRAGEEMKASNDTGEDLGLTADGGRPLFDAALVELYERKFGEVA